jgi:hypothetical protein
MENTDKIDEIDALIDKISDKIAANREGKEDSLKTITDIRILINSHFGPEHPGFGDLLSRFAKMAHSNKRLH